MQHNAMGKKDQFLGVLCHCWVFLLSSVHLPYQKVSEAELSKAMIPLLKNDNVLKPHQSQTLQEGGQCEERIKAELTETGRFFGSPC